MENRRPPFAQSLQLNKITGFEQSAKDFKTTIIGSGFQSHITISHEDEKVLIIKKTLINKRMPKDMEMYYKKSRMHVYKGGEKK